MKSSLLIPQRTSRKIKGIANMAATDGTVQRLTFYEDLYLKPYKKSASMPGRRSTPSTPVLRKNTKRQSSISECQRTSWSKSPVNNPLLDSPPSSRPLSLAGKTRTAAESQTSLADSNNNDYLRLSATAWLPLQNGATSKSASENVYENHRCIRAIRGNKSPSKPLTDHVYEVIPANTPSFYHRTHYIADESNYIVSKTAAKNHEQSNQNRNVPCNKGCASTNLRSMRRIGRSVDSIRNIPDNKLRSQSTILAPKLWIKSPVAGLANSASCDNLLSGQSTEQPKLSTVVSPDKENHYPYTCVAKQPNRTQNTDSTLRVSPKARQSAENLSQKGSNNSIHHATLRATSMSKVQHTHRHSSSYSGSSSAYENMANVHKNLKASRSEYVNIEDYINQDSDLNYADLDLTLQKPMEKPNTSNGKHCRSASSSPTKLAGAHTDNNEDSVEYTFINIAATEAARLACKEHQQDRQRRTHSITSKTS